MSRKIDTLSAYHSEEQTLSHSKQLASPRDLGSPESYFRREMQALRRTTTDASCSHCIDAEDASASRTPKSALATEVLFTDRSYQEPFPQSN